VPTIWIGLLFSILCLSAQFEVTGAGISRSSFAGEALRDAHEAVPIFREKTVQCLVLSNYTQPGPYTVETLMMYYICEHFRSHDTQFGAWMVFGLLVRAAMRLGFHRDASHYPKISAFQGEMRRRMWGAIVHMDLLTSLQVGLPRMIREGMYDTEDPKNLLDEDFDENTKFLPPSRPFLDMTPTGYQIAKHGITKLFGVIVDLANSTHAVPYEEVLILDKQLHEQYQDVPQPLKVKSLEELDSDSPDVIFRKFGIELTFQKARCVLHRKYFVPSRSTSTYLHPYSTKACLAAAMKIVQSQILIHGETRPGKALHAQRWIASSLITQDFLLAAVLICLYLGHDIDAVYPGDQSGLESGIRAEWTRSDMLQALEGSYQIWVELSSSSKEAEKILKVLKYMLARVKNQEQLGVAKQNHPQNVQASLGHGSSIMQSCKFP